MKEKWIDAGDTLFGYPAIRNNITEELCIAGKYGEIWRSGDGWASVLIHNHFVANRLSIRNFSAGKPFKEGEEGVFKGIPEGSIPELLIRLQTRRNRKLQIGFMEAYRNKRRGIK